MADDAFSIAPSGSSIAEALRAASLRLRQAGVESPDRDARLLLAAAARLDSLEIIRCPERVLGAPEAAAFAAMISRRLSREPVSRILGLRAFYGREFAVTPATLDPRPDSETVVDMALEIAAEQGWRDKTIRILDIGTGTGCLLLTLLAELPLSEGVGTDIDPAALDVARDNARRLGVESRARFETRRSLAAISGPFDLLVSNPPYIPTAEIEALEPEVRQFDPRAALDGGADGLGIYGEIAAGFSRVVPNGVAVLEVGAGQSTAVAALFDGQFVRQIRRKTDLGGHERCVAVWTQS
jgi:release factor glutamine methyltransferase